MAISPLKTIGLTKFCRISQISLSCFFFSGYRYVHLRVLIFAQSFFRVLIFCKAKRTIISNFWIFEDKIQTSFEQGRNWVQVVTYLFRILPLQHTIMLHTPLHRNNNILHLHCESSVQISTTQAWRWRTSPLTRQGSPTTETEELQLYEVGTATSIRASTTLKIINKMKNN